MRKCRQAAQLKISKNTQQTKKHEANPTRKIYEKNHKTKQRERLEWDRLYHEKSI